MVTKQIFAQKWSKIIQNPLKMLWLLVLIKTWMKQALIFIISGWL